MKTQKAIPSQLCAEITVLMREQKPYLLCPGGGGGVLPIMAPPERSTFFRLQVYERVGILLVGVHVYEGGGICHLGL